MAHYFHPTADQGTGSGDSEANAEQYTWANVNTAITSMGSGGTIYFLDGDYDFASANFLSQAQSGTDFRSLNKHGAKWYRTSAGQFNIQPSDTSRNHGFYDLVFENIGMIFTTNANHTEANSFIVSGCKFTSTSAINVSTSSWLFRNFSGNVWRCYDNDINLEIGAGSNFGDFRSAKWERTSLYFNISGTGLTLDATITSAAFKNSIFMTSDNSQMNSTKNYATLSTNCCIYQFGSGQSGGTSNVLSDPQFVDAPNGDLRLRPTSPCIGAATTS